ncbi:MAG TPA: NAD(P)-dependent alcohol dehydrogenase, partial [Chthoniobacterales bacterium]
MNQIKAFAAQSPSSPLAPFSIERREPTATDVEFDILFCGVCHSDLHTARDEWGGTTFPCVPGHEIVGRVTRVGPEVKNFKPGDLAAVGCMVDSDRTCPQCRDGFEQFCDSRATFTYNSPDKHSGGVTYGGYSKRIVVDEAFVLRISDKLDLAATAPLLCAGITTYSPLRRWKIGKGHKVGVVGLGGLGHMGLKLANAFGAEVVLFTTSPGKTEDAKRLGAHDVVVSKNEDEMKKHANSFDFILDTVSAKHPVNAYLQLLNRDGTLCMVGASPDALPLDVFSLIGRRRQIAGSLIGGIRETQEMLDFCTEHGIVSDIELIRMDQINEAYERMLR